MKDYEIILWLKSVMPESDKQKKSLEAAERAFYKASDYFDNEELNDFLEAYDRSDLIGKPSGELYEEYLEYCNDYDLTEVTHSTLTRFVTHKFNLKVVVGKVNNKSVRVYKA